jgi:hypothetical protein
LRGLYKDLDIADIGMDWTCSKNGSGKEGQLREYWRVNWEEVEKGEDRE